ncbi:hypothetical protein [Parasitella parasitica]|uniref:Uncharacterized protein n=1 Tax=Parasitella parasitica TaxID=35722 RepID=A0A0B7NDB4_9FUNG|nr:hypothetical protein [Parasitella parasitica]
MLSNNLISLSSVSNLRLENFRTQHELAKNFYDDYDFCPVHHTEEVSEHRERVQKRTSPYPSPNSSVSSNSSATSFCYKSSNYYQHSLCKSNSTSIVTSTAVTSTTATRAIPIIDPSNMTPVAVPVHQQHLQKTYNSTSPSTMPQWIAFKNNTSSMSTSPSSVHSNLSLSSSGSSINSSISHGTTEYHQDYYYGNYQQQQIMPSTVVRTIPIIDPTTRQAFHHQQQAIPPPGFYNVSVC